MKFAWMVMLLLLIGREARAVGADTVRVPFRVEASVEGGPMFSFFAKPTVSEGAPSTTVGSQVIGRLLWHPNKLLALGLASGYMVIRHENFTVRDAGKRSDVEAWLTSVPILIDVEMEWEHFEAGVGLGAFIITSYLSEHGESYGTRLELATMYHIARRWSITPTLSIGPELVLNYMDYRGIVSVVPQVTLLSTLFTH
jgi:hypothetical protein